MCNFFSFQYTDVIQGLCRKVGRGRGDRGLEDVETRGLGDSGTWRRVFTICLTFHHISQNPRLLIVTAL